LVPWPLSTWRIILNEFMITFFVNCKGRDLEHGNPCGERCMAKYAFLKARGMDTVLRVHVQPRGGKNEIVGLYRGFLKLRLKAPPVDGEANRECLRFLSKILKQGRGQLEILHGERSRWKNILVRDRNVQELESLFEAILPLSSGNT